MTPFKRQRAFEDVLRVLFVHENEKSRESLKKVFHEGFMRPERAVRV